MRRILLATVLASPMFLAATAFASSPAEDATISSPALPVSTGVTGPQLIHSARVLLAPEVANTTSYDSRVVLRLNVDEQGKAQDIQVIKAQSPALGDSVADAVRQFRWQPATLDKHAVPMNLTLNVMVQH